MNTIETLDPTPFKHLVMSIGALPTSFVDGMSYYECMAWLVAYIRDNVVPACNNNAEAIKEIQEWIETLDLQDEVDNKLDEMAESGELAEIISQYLNSTAIFGYDTVADMKAAENLVDGSYAHTFGYYSKNDGGGALYKIRNITNDDVIDEAFIVEMNDSQNNLIAELITDDNITIKQLGAKSDIDSSVKINASLTKLNYAIIPEGTFNCSTTITIKARQLLKGTNRSKSVLHYTGIGSFIESENVSTNIYITIQDLTITGSNSGYGLYFERTVKDGDSWHRISNLNITNFEYGAYFKGAMNEIQLSDIKASSNDYGIYVQNVDDFYIERCITCVNGKDGLTLNTCTEGRISDTKSWYNGSTSASDYYNLVLVSCLAISLVNVTLQESYGSNVRLSYSKNIQGKNIYLSKPCLDGNLHYQLILNNLLNSNLEIVTANTKVNGSYVNKVMQLYNNSIGNTIKIMTEDDFPYGNYMQSEGSNNGCAYLLKNTIEIGGLRINKIPKNFCLNGDLSNTAATITDYITVNGSYCSIVSGKLRFTNDTTAAVSIGMKYAAVPEVGLYSAYVRFKKVSGTGRVTLLYSGYKDITNETTTTEELYVTHYNVKDNTTSSIINLSIPAGMTIDIEEFGYVNNTIAEIGTPLAATAVL